MKKWIIRIAVLTVLLLGILAGYFLYHAEFEVNFEAGEEIRMDAFWTGCGNAAFSRDAEPVNSHVPGSYRSKICLGGWLEWTVTVIIQDTVPPRIETKEVTLCYGKTCELQDFIACSEDATQLSYYYMKEPDFSCVGYQDIQIEAVDLGGNRTKADARLFIPNIRESVQSEIGEELPDAAEFLVDPSGSAKYLSDLSWIDLNRIQERKVKVIVDGQVYESILKLADTIAPKAELISKEGWLHKQYVPEDFILSIEDRSEVETAFETEPDWEKEGTQEVAICLTDEGGNSSVFLTCLTLHADRVAPVIIGSDITAAVGENISYKKAISMTDNCDLPEELKLDIDTKSVNLKEPGDYLVSCTVTDTSGNAAEKELTVHIVPENKVKYDLETVNQLADRVLEKIITEEMSQYEKAEKIYDWIRGNVGYVSTSKKGDWLEGAYEGLAKHKGDCYVFACTAKALLSRAGIPNLDVVKETETSLHYWNLVDAGEGWYHFDTTPRKDKTVFFMWTDEQLKEYSEKHNGTHDFDRTLYPPIN